MLTSATQFVLHKSDAVEYQRMYNYYLGTKKANDKPHVQAVTQYNLQANPNVALSAY